MRDLKYGDPPRRRIIVAMALVATVLCFAVSGLCATPEASDRTSQRGNPGQRSQSQELDSPEQYFSKRRRRSMYRAEKLSLQKALFYSALVPGVGNLYVEQTRVAIVSFSLLSFAAVFTGYGLVSDQRGYLASGLITAAVTYLGSGTASLIGVQRYNQRLKDRYNIGARDQMRSPKLGHSFALGVSFPF